jgi:cephalosporin hydroxylase
MIVTDNLETMYQAACSGLFNQSSPAINEHLPTLRKIGYGNVVEFGCEFGNSTVAFILSNAKSVLSVDIKITNNIKFISTLSDKHKYKEISSLEINMPKCDVLFIDTDHCYQQLHDELYRNHKEVRGKIIMHDTELFKLKSPYDGREGLQRAIDEFLNDFPEWKVEKVYKNNNGLTILTK